MLYAKKFFASFCMTAGIGVLAITLISAGSRAMADEGGDGPLCYWTGTRCNLLHDCVAPVPYCTKKTSQGGGTIWCDCTSTIPE